MRFRMLGMTTVLMLAAATGARAGVTLTQDGKAVAVIVHNGFERQAKDLQDYLKRITGAEFPLTHRLDQAPADLARIVLDTATPLPGASVRPEIARQAYRIATDGNTLRLTGGSDLGVTYAVWGFLEDHLGCRFYSFAAKGLQYAGPGFEVVPSQPNLTVKPIDDFQQPHFAQRGLIYWVGSYPWIPKNRAAGYPSDKFSGALSASHCFYELLPPNDKKDGKGVVVRKGLFAEHPEFYPLTKDGKREQGWNMGLCGTNPDLPGFLASALQEETEKRIKRLGDHYDPFDPIPAAQGDGFSGCLCEACRQLVRDEQSEAAPYILMLNRALDILGKTHPKQRVITFAYFETLAVPRTIKPHANLWIDVVSSDWAGHTAGDQVGPIHDNPANRDYAKALREWPKVAPGRVVGYHWVPGGQGEWPAIFYLGDMVRFWRDCGLYGVNPQICGDNWKWLYCWVFFKLAWNPDADADALIHQFLEDNYGKGAAPPIWEYLKLAQAAYADSGHVPGVCRWTGFVSTCRLKMYPPPLVKRMTALMDKAQAAAAKEKNPALLANLIEARGNAIDRVNLDAAKAAGNWGPVKNPEDGKRWFVANADPLVPPCVMRAKQSIVMNGGGEPGVLRSVAAVAAGNGGPLVELEGGGFTAAVCPDLRGQVTSAVDQRSGRELLAVADAETGYRDMFPGSIQGQIWLPVSLAEQGVRQSGEGGFGAWSRFANPDQARLETDLTLTPPMYGFDPNNHLRRTVTAGDDGLRIERTYVQTKGGKMPNPTRFTTRWLLALPDPAKANVAVVGGGIKKMLDLRYAVSGGIRGVKAGDRVSVGAGADKFIVDNIVDAEAVSDVQVSVLAVASNSADTITIQLDRGDGVAAMLTTPAAGWESVELQPVVDKKHLRVTLVGVPVAMGPDPVTNALPVQTLTAKPVAVSTVKRVAAEEQKPVAKVKDLGRGRGVNEVDGAELIWIPAGEFLRGSPAGQGASDERPRKKVFLDGYWIYKHPVTLAQYTNYCAATGKKFEPTWGQSLHSLPAGDPNRYAALMNWFEADAYAQWAGAALPSEAQWEKAARGTDGREYPWGDAWDPEKAVGLERTTYRFASGLMPVDSSPQGASPYGVDDMAGNCWEWVADWYEHEYYRRAPGKNPTGPEAGTHKVLRGGFALFDERFSRSASRMVQPPQVRDWTPTGFRCVVAGPAPALP